MRTIGGRATFRLLPDPSHPIDDGLDSLWQHRNEAVRAAGALSRVAVQPDAGARYVGSSACIECHTAIYKEWKRTPHAAALHRLRDAGASWDPACVGCHVDGWRRDGGTWARVASGFRTPDKSGYLGGVGCESCHGPGSKHLMDPWNPNAFVGAYRRAQDTCRTCHDAVTDPGFADDVPGHLERARHTRVPSDRRTVVPTRLLERLRRAGLAPR